MCLPVKSTKLAISAAEWQMASTTEVILTKNKIIDNVMAMYGMLADDYRECSTVLAQKLPAVFNIHPKISKGENYEGMPWVMLDYPRCYSKTEGHFAIRCFFWWGHFFSVSLHLSGEYLVQFHHVLEALHQQQWYVGFTKDPWNQHLPNKNWGDLHRDNFSNLDTGMPYAKAAKKIPVSEWPQVKFFFEDQFKELIITLFPNN